MENNFKSFDEYFTGYKNYDDGGKLDQLIIADAKKVFETLKSPDIIVEFQKADYEKQQRMVPGLDEGHSGFSFGCVCQCAFNYANYKAKEQPYTFDEYFAGYKNYDNGGKLDQLIIADAKKVYETLKSPNKINSFFKADYEKQQRMVPGLDEGHSGFSFGCVCQCAFRYASYAKKYINNTLENKLSSLRKKLAQKIGKKLETKEADIKMNKHIKNVEAKISKKFDRSGR